MSQIAKQIEAILRQDPRARDSDNVLIVHLLQLHGAKLNADQIAVVCGLNFESVTRARRKLQEDGQYLPSAAVAKERQLRAQVVAQGIRTTNAAGAQQLVSTGLHPNIKPDAPLDVQNSLLELLEWAEAPVRKNTR